MEAERKQTMGTIALDLAKSAHDNTHSAHDQMRESLTDWDKNIYECVERSKKEFPFDFYIVVITKKEKLLENVLRNYFTGRISCPTPDYDQTVFRYDRFKESLEFIWVIPSKDTCLYMKENPLEIHPEERQLLQFVLDFADGSLFRKAKELNREEMHSVVLKE